MNKEKEIYLRCSCGSEILHLSHTLEDGMQDVAVFQYLNGGHGRMTLRDKVRYCWKLLTDGKPYGDCLILSPEDAKKLHGYLGLCEHETHKFKTEKASASAASKVPDDKFKDI
jgi:hypothetical protein